MHQFFSSSVCLGCITALSIIALTWLYKRKRWLPIGRLTGIYIYPLKSGKYIELPDANCTSLGLRYVAEDNKAPLRDRVFIVYDKETKKFLSGKANNNMVFIIVRPKTADSVIFSYPGKPDIEVSLSNKFDDNAIVEFYTPQRLPTYDCGDEIAKWMSEVVRGETNGLRVGYWPEPENYRRDVVSLYPQESSVFKKMSNKFTGAYSDLASYLLINNNSVQDLNERVDISDRVNPLNFRPNFVIEGIQPYAEDKLDWIKIGDAVFRTFRPCTRCAFTTVNPETGDKNSNNEPLTTMKKYRTMEMLGEDRIEPTTPVMGVYLGLHQEGVIKKGDTVYVLN